MSRTVKPHIFKRDGVWSVFIPALNWTTSSKVVTGTLDDVYRAAWSYWRVESDRLARR